QRQPLLAACRWRPSATGPNFTKRPCYCDRACYRKVYFPVTGPVNQYGKSIAHLYGKSYRSPAKIRIFRPAESPVSPLTKKYTFSIRQGGKSNEKSYGRNHGAGNGSRVGGVWRKRRDPRSNGGNIVVCTFFCPCVRGYGIFCGRYGRTGF